MASASQRGGTPVRGGVGGAWWKFAYWPLLWLAAIVAPHALLGGSCRLEGVGLEASRLLGLILIAWATALTSVAGRTLRLYGHSEGGGFWPDRLVKVGVYSCMRHPQHLGLALAAVGLGLLLASPVAIASSGWAVAGTLLFVLLVEEPECYLRFGREYLEYSMSVKAFSLDPRCLLRGLRALKGTTRARSPPRSPRAQPSS